MLQPRVPNEHVSDKLWRLLQNSRNAHAAVYGSSAKMIEFSVLNAFQLQQVQKFMILQLYLHSAPAIKFHSASIHSAKPLVRFSDTKNPNTLWVAHPLDPKEQLRMPLGIHIPVGKSTLNNCKDLLDTNLHLMLFLAQNAPSY